MTTLPPTNHEVLRAADALRRIHTPDARDASTLVWAAEVLTRCAPILESTLTEALSAEANPRGLTWRGGLVHLMSRADLVAALLQHFADWESHVFGYGYGTGEEHVLTVLKTFLAATDADHGNYSYETLERELTPPVAWLLINTLCHADIIEYGTSPRYGWLTDRGKRLRDFVAGRTVDQLYEIAASREHFPCYPDVCNCDRDDPKQRCRNPFWREVPA